MILDKLLGSGVIPDSILRVGIQYLLKKRLKSEEKLYRNPNWETNIIEELRNSPIALSTDEANKQHYEVPSEFYKLVLGPNLKYSAGLWNNQNCSLEESELAMLALTCKRANIQNGQQVLDLGCGWGSLSLYIARNFKNMKITSISNSRTQKKTIEEIAKKENLSITVLKKDVSKTTLTGTFDRILSIEMFEHMRNYEKLLENCRNILAKDGRLFVHIFGHKRFTYPFKSRAEENWMGRYFFENGLMPSKVLFSNFNKDLCIDNQWVVNGQHYQKTCEAWLKNMDNNIEDIRPLFKKTYGKLSSTFETYWRIFFMACEELFSYKKGNEWQVYHYLFKKA